MSGGYSKVTRVEVIDHSPEGTTVAPRRGRTQWLGVHVQLSLQDEGRTLKVFLSGSEIATPDEVGREMAAGWTQREE